MEPKVIDNEIVSWCTDGKKHICKRTDGSTITSDDGIMWSKKRTGYSYPI